MGYLSSREKIELLGSCSLHHIDAGSYRAETGYDLHRAEWGKGIMAEAMSAILTYGFTELGTASH